MFRHLYAPIFDHKKRGVVTDSAQLRLDFLSSSRDPINTDSALHYTRPREHFDMLPRPNFLIGQAVGLMPLVDVFARSPNSKTPYGLNPTDPAGSALPMPIFALDVNGLKKVG